MQKSKFGGNAGKFGGESQTKLGSAEPIFTGLYMDIRTYRLNRPRGRLSEYHNSRKINRNVNISSPLSLIDSLSFPSARLWSYYPSL